MSKDKTDAQSMREFSDNLLKVYRDAEWLRDCAGGRDKDIFNKVRGALYDLVDKAREQARRWELGERG